MGQLSILSLCLPRIHLITLLWCSSLLARRHAVGIDLGWLNYSLALYRLVDLIAHPTKLRLQILLVASMAVMARVVLERTLLCVHYHYVTAHLVVQVLVRVQLPFFARLALTKILRIIKSFAVGTGSITHRDFCPLGGILHLFKLALVEVLFFALFVIDDLVEGSTLHILILVESLMMITPVLWVTIRALILFLLFFHDIFKLILSLHLVNVLQGIQSLVRLGVLALELPQLRKLRMSLIQGVLSNLLPLFFGLLFRFWSVDYGSRSSY